MSTTHSTVSPFLSQRNNVTDTSSERHAVSAVGLVNFPVHFCRSCRRHLIADMSFPHAVLAQTTLSCGFIAKENKQTNKQASKLARARAHTHTTNTHTHACMHARTHARTQTRTQTRTHAGTRTHTHARTHTQSKQIRVTCTIPYSHCTTNKNMNKWRHCRGVYNF